MKKDLDPVVYRRKGSGRFEFEFWDDRDKRVFRRCPNENDGAQRQDILLGVLFLLLAVVSPGDDRSFYLDRRTSFFETLDKTSAEAASIRTSGNGETVVGHVYHVLFYLDALREYTTGERTGKTNWEESWSVTAATETEWAALQAELRRAYRDVMALVKEPGEGDAEDLVSGTLSILAHSAFHLGSIRQIVDSVSHAAGKPDQREQRSCRER